MFDQNIDYATSNRECEIKPKRSSFSDISKDIKQIYFFYIKCCNIESSDSEIRSRKEKLMDDKNLIEYVLKGCSFINLHSKNQPNEVFNLRHCFK